MSVMSLAGPFVVLEAITKNSQNGLILANLSEQETIMSEYILNRSPEHRTPIVSMKVN